MMNKVQAIGTDSKGNTDITLTPANGPQISLELTKADVAMLVDHFLSTHTVQLMPKTPSVHTSHTARKS